MNLRWIKPARLLLSIWLGAMALHSCAPPPPPPPPPRAQQVLYEWHDTGGPGQISMHINLTSQIATIYCGGQEVGWCYVATGREGHATRPGNYRITELVVDKISNRWGWHENEFGEIVNPSARFDQPVPPGLRYVPAPMPYWMRLTDYGIGLHGGIIPNPGSPASAGCIRLPKDFAPVLYQKVRIGTPVTIVR